MKDDDLDDELIEPPPKAPKLVLILLGLNLAITAFVAFKVLTAAPAEAVAEEEPEDDPNVPGPLHTFQPFVVNLNDVENPRYLKVAIDAELANEEVLKTIDDTHTRIARDSAMRYLSSLTLNDVMGEAAKDTIATELAARLNKALGEGTVRRILFVEFVVQ